MLPVLSSMSALKLSESCKTLSFLCHSQIDVSYSNERVQLSPEQVTGALFAHLKALAEHVLEGVHVSDVVISVPPFFTDQMRRAMLNAAHIAGLNGMRRACAHSVVSFRLFLFSVLLFRNDDEQIIFSLQPEHACMLHSLLILFI